MRLLPGSLRGRLLLAAMLLITVALLGTAALTNVILDRFMHRQIDQQLDTQIVTLHGALAEDARGHLTLNRTVDGPPFDRQMSGWYWQVRSGAIILRSVSLGGHMLETPVNASPARPPPPPNPPPQPPPPIPVGFAGPPPAPADGPGPDGTALHFRTKDFTLGARLVTITATAPQDAFARPLHEAMTAVLLALAITAVTLISAMVFQVHLGLQPLRDLSRAVAEVRAGRINRLPDRQPSEIAPLTEELNKLIADNAEGLARARRHVANLAHGLKTPLANLSVAVESRDGAPNGELLALVDLMDRRIRHHLARARSAALAGPARAQTALAPRIDDVVSALSRIHAQKRISTEVIVNSDATVACESQDVDEILGNLIDNAFKWAVTRVRVCVQPGDRTISIAIEDDGPGLSSGAIDDVLRPGLRLDERAPGYGFGLPIARELAELYGGHLDLGRSTLGGLRVTLSLPAAAHGKPRAAG